MLCFQSFKHFLSVITTVNKQHSLQYNLRALGILTPLIKNKVAGAIITLSVYIKFIEKIIKLWHLISLVFPDKDKWMAWRFCSPALVCVLAQVYLRLPAPTYNLMYEIK